MLKIYVCCHKPSVVLKNECLFPIQVGTSLSAEKFSGYLHDDIGENISSKNRSYCELTAQYWAWKNDEADIYGFFHYRRYLDFKRGGNRPYYLAKMPDSKLLDAAGYGALEKLVSKHDVTVPKCENIYVTVRRHYANAKFHHAGDLQLVENIVAERYPQFCTSLEKYLGGTLIYFGNIYVMRREIFFDYCQWLFSILEEFDKRKDTGGYSAQELRVDGYLAERLLGVYITYLRDSGASVCECTGIHFEQMGGNGEGYFKKVIINSLLPPGSRRRAWAKNLRRCIT